jgi:hypothetical protein
MKTIYYLATLLLALSQPILGCVCGGGAGFQEFTPAMREEYDHIALVKILTFEPFAHPKLTEEEKKFAAGTFARFTVQYIEHFKGDKRTEFLLSSYNTSCDIGLRAGQEWIIMAKESRGYATVFPCEYSKQFRDENGVRDWLYGTGFKLLTNLEKMYKKPVVKKNGKEEGHYPNGQLEYSLTYVKGQLHGERQIWHPNGKLWGQQYFNHGKQEGKSTWWFASGYVYSESRYLDGHEIDTTRNWFEPDGLFQPRSYFEIEDPFSDVHLPVDSLIKLHSTRQLYSYFVYDSTGQMREDKYYDRSGRLAWETQYFPEQKMYCTIYYDTRTGKLSYIAMNVLDPKSSSPLFNLDFDQKNNSHRKFYFDRNGSQVKVTRVENGQETILEQKKK